MSDVFDVLIVGTGPAGLSAAVELARLDVHVEVIDDNPAYIQHPKRTLADNFLFNRIRYITDITY